MERKKRRNSCARTGKNEVGTGKEEEEGGDGERQKQQQQQQQQLQVKAIEKVRKKKQKMKTKEDEDVRSNKKRRKKKKKKGASKSLISTLSSWQERSDGVFPADVLFSVAEFLELEEIVKCRRVCSWWREVFSAESIWRKQFHRRFGTPLNTDELECWFAEYARVVSCMPIGFFPVEQGVRDQDDKKKRYLCHIGDDQLNQLGEDEPWVFDGEESFGYSFPDVFCRWANVDAETIQRYEIGLHKLVLIMHILHEYNRQLHPMNDMVRIGYRFNEREMPNWSTKHERRNWTKGKSCILEEDTEVIPLSKFCYSILTGQEKTLFSRMRQNDPGLSDLIMDTPDDGWSETEFKNDTKNNPTRWSVGVSPNIQGKFEPVVHYLGMKGRFLKQHYYSWSTTENGWLPGYFDASFSWFYWAYFQTQCTLSPEKRIQIRASFFKAVVW